MTHIVLEDFRLQGLFSDSIAIDLDQIEAEVENEDNEEEVNFEVNWRNDFEELEKALEDDSGELELFSIMYQAGLNGPGYELVLIGNSFVRRHGYKRLLSFQNSTCSRNLESYKIGPPYG